MELIINHQLFLDGLILAEDSLHHLTHWQRVEKYGLMIAETNGADQEVIKLFAYLHDARRRNDEDDPGHGERAAVLLDELIGEGLISLSDLQYTQLRSALRQHDRDDAASEDITVRTCWDADRLDLWRGDIIPNPQLMFTDCGRSASMIEFARNLVAQSS